MKKVQLKIDKKYLVILAVFVVAAVLLGVSLGIYLGTEGGADSLPAWITVIVIILLVALPLLLLALLFAVLGDKGAARYGAVRPEEQADTAEQTAEQAVAPSVKKGESKIRFDGLTRIDGRRAALADEAFEDGVTLPALCEEFTSNDVLFYNAQQVASKTFGLEKGDKIVITGGVTDGRSGNTNLIKVEEI